MSRTYSELNIGAYPSESRVSTPARLLGLLNSRPVWTIADQAIVSLGNFLSGVILARHLPETGYGAYALLLETMLFLNSLQAAIVTYPMSVRGATHDSRNLRRFASAALWLTLALLPALGAAMGIAVLCGAQMGMSGVGSLPLAIGAIAGMVLWQMQETMRCALMAEFRFGACIPGDALSYLGQVGLLSLLATFGALTLPRAFFVIGSTSALAVVLQAMQVGIVRVSFAEFVEIARDFWKLGSWTLLANIAMVLTTMGYTWMLKLLRGLDATADFAAILVPFRLANPLLLGIGNLLVPAVARAARKDGVRASARAAGRYSLLGGAVIFTYYGVLCAFPSLALRLVFGSGSPYLNEGTWLRLYALNMCVMYVELVLQGWLSGLGESRANFMTQIVQAAATLSVTLPATALYGIPGLIGGAFVGTTLCVIAQSFMLGKALRVRIVASWPPIRSFGESLPAPD